MAVSGVNLQPVALNIKESLQFMHKILWMYILKKRSITNTNNNSYLHDQINMIRSFLQKTKINTLE